MLTRPPDLGTDVVRFFEMAPGTSARLRTLQDFIDTNPRWNEELDFSYLMGVCRRLEHAGYLWQGHVEGHPILGQTYVAPKFDEAVGAYGTYRFAVLGFPSILDHFRKSVLAVEVGEPDGTIAIGTCFLMGNANTLVTARHVVEGKNSVRVLTADGCPVSIESVAVPRDADTDFAILLIRDAGVRCLPHFNIADAEPLEEVLCLGYPPIPGFRNILISDRSTLGAVIKPSLGRVVTAAESYLDREDFILINARVKGGNSGGPVVNRKGNVVGLLVQIPMDAEDSDRLDHLGYGIAVPKSSIIRLLPAQSGGPGGLVEIDITQLDEGAIQTAWARADHVI